MRGDVAGEAEVVGLDPLAVLDGVELEDLPHAVLDEEPHLEGMPGHASVRQDLHAQVRGVEPIQDTVLPLDPERIPVAAAFDRARSIALQADSPPAHENFPGLDERSGSTDARKPGEQTEEAPAQHHDRQRTTARGGGRGVAPEGESAVRRTPRSPR